MSTQIPLFEPSGAELPQLARQHLGRFASLQTHADNLTARGFMFSALSYSRSAVEAVQLAEQCETAYQFETLAGLIQ